MKAVGPVAVLVAALLLASGCTQTVAGRLRPAPDLVSIPVTGESVAQVLLDQVELAEMFHGRFESSPKMPPRFGGVDELSDNWSSAWPPDCVGVAVVAPRSAYQSVGVQDVAWESWRHAAVGVPDVTGVTEAVVALPTVAEARSAFETFTGRWRGCDGVTVTRENSPATLAADISELRIDDTVLAATVHTTIGRILGMWSRRALGVQGNCLVEAEVFFTANDMPRNESAPDAVRAMMTKADQLSAGG